ncbi:hypothetical protein RCOM_1781620, partial [Ricinus communis]
RAGLVPRRLRPPQGHCRLQGHAAHHEDGRHHAGRGRVSHRQARTLHRRRQEALLGPRSEAENAGLTPVPACATSLPPDGTAPDFNQPCTRAISLGSRHGACHGNTKAGPACPPLQEQLPMITSVPAPPVTPPIAPPVNPPPTEPLVPPVGDPPPAPAPSPYSDPPIAPPPPPPQG